MSTLAVPATILVIEDEPKIRQVVREALRHIATKHLDASTGREGLSIVSTEQPSLIILDLGLPDDDGLRVCQAIRTLTPVPIVVLSARHSEDEKVALLDAGADDYITKPFSTAELQARVRAHLRRTRAADIQDEGAVLAFGPLHIDHGSRTVTVDGNVVHLTPTEWGLLRTFTAHPDRTLTHQQLFRAVWGAASGDAQQYLRVYVAQLRRKIEADPVRPKFIKTESAVGYRFVTGT